MFEPNNDSDFAADGRNRQLEVVMATPLIRTVRALLLMKWMLLVVILEVNSLISNQSSVIHTHVKKFCVHSLN